MEQETGEGQEGQPCQDGGQPLAVAGEAAEAGGPGETALHAPSLGEQDEAAFGFRRRDHDQLDAVRRRAGRRIGTGVARLDKGELDALPRRRLDLGRQRLHLRALVVAGRRHGEREQRAQGLDGEVRRRSGASFGPTLPRPAAALRRRLPYPRVHDHRAGLRLSALEDTQQQARILDQRLTAPRRQPASDLRTRPRPTGGNRWANSARGRRYAPESARR